MTLEMILGIIKGTEAIVAHFKQRAAEGHVVADDGHIVTPEELQQAVDAARAVAQGLTADAEASLQKRHG